MKYADMAQAQAAVLIAEMEKGHPFLPFLKPGDPALVNGLPYNPTTGRAYRGGNMVMLWIAGMVEGYEDRRWLTYKQAQSIGAQVRKGAKSVPLRYVIYPERDGEGVLTSSTPRPFHFSVFNAEQIDGLPLARFEYVLARHGVTVPRQTLARWVIGAAGVLQPLLNLMLDALLDGPFLHVDETVVQVLKEAGKAPTSNSYMWVQTGGPPGRPVVVFDYDASRSGQVPLRLLHDYRGYVMTDGYSGYNELMRTDGIEQLICWAHVRRRFVEAVKVQPKGKRGLADEAVAMIGKLYGVERDHQDADDATRLLARQARSVPALAALRTWLDQTLPGVTPKSALGTALSYLRDYWPRLTRYTERGDLPIDNNRAENAIRPFVVGRKAWLFSDTVAGANASAVIYSVLETAKANGVEPYTWLRRVLRELPTAQTVEDVEALLPWNVSALDHGQSVTPMGVLQ